MNNWIYEVIFNLIKNQMFIAIVSAVLVYEFNKYKEFKNKNEERRSVLNALQAELSSLNLLICNREEQFSQFVTDESKNKFCPYIPITLNYFSVFDNISFRFGLIKNREVIEKLIKCYTEIKGLFDNVKDLEYHAKMVLNIKIQSDYNKNYLNALIQTHRFYVTCIVNEQLPMVKRLIEETIQCIDDERSTIESKNSFSCFLKE